jgi:hypothetical protein
MPAIRSLAFVPVPPSVALVLSEDALARCRRLAKRELASLRVQETCRLRSGETLVLDVGLDAPTICIKADWSRGL